MTSETPRFENIAVDAIEKAEIELRGHADEEALEELRRSIKKRGILVPLIVTETSSGYRLVAGLRRLLCAAMNGLATVPAMIVASSVEWEAWATLAENSLREGVNAVDEATYIAAVVDKRNLSHVQMAAMLDKSESWVSQRLAILRWPPEVRDAVRQGWLSFAAGREIAAIGSPGARKLCLDTARRLGCTARRAATWRRNWLKEQGPGGGSTPASFVDEPTEPSGEMSGCLFCDKPVPTHEGMVLFGCNGCLAVIQDALKEED